MKAHTTVTLVLLTTYSASTAPTSDSNSGHRDVVSSRKTDLTITVYESKGCKGAKDYSSNPEYAQNMCPYEIHSFSLSRALEDSEQLDFSAPSEGMAGPGVTLSLDQACYLFETAWLGNLPKGCTDLRSMAGCFRLWQIW